MGLVFALLDVALSQDVLFCQSHQLQCLHHCFTKAYLCSLCAPFISPLLHRWWFQFMCYGFGVRLEQVQCQQGCYSLHEMLPQEFEKLEAKRVVKSCHELTHPFLIWWLVCTLMIKHSVFSIMAALIRDAFILSVLHF